MFKKINILIGGLIFAVSAIAYADPGVSLNKLFVKSRVGNTISVDIVLSGFPTTEGGGVDLHFNPALVQVKSLVVDEATWDFVNSGGVIDNAQGIVSGVLFSSYHGISDAARIATVELEFVGKGKGFIVLSEADSNPFASDGEHVAVDFSPTHIQVYAAK